MTRRRTSRAKQESKNEQTADEQVSAFGLRHPTNLFLTVLPVVAAILTAGGVFLHTIGAITHRTFLSEMGVPPDVFPKDTASTLINGYYALFDRWFLLFKALVDQTGTFILYSFVTTIAILLYWLLLRWQPKGWEEIKSWPSWVRVLVRLFAVALAIVGTIPGAICAILLVMLMVGAPGEYAGKAHAEKLRDRYAKGCAVEAPCTNVLRSGTILVTGAMLDASPSHIAIYDPQTRLSYVLEMSGHELRQSVGSNK